MTKMPLPPAPCPGVANSLMGERAYEVSSQAFEVSLALPPAMPWVGRGH